MAYENKLASCRKKRFYSEGTIRENILYGKLDAKLQKI